MDESKGDLKPVDNTFLLTPALKWEIASNPFNKYSSVRNDISVQQISPSYGFAHYLSRHIHSKIGMIVNGRGGTSISEWTKGSGIGPVSYTHLINLSYLPNNHFQTGITSIAHFSNSIRSSSSYVIINNCRHSNTCLLYTSRCV